MTKKDTRLKAKSWGIIIPCEWDCHMKIVYRAKEVAKKYYWIKHDKDSHSDTGEIKKEHVHLVMTFSNAIALNTMRNYFKEFGQLKENSYEKITNIHGAIRYLLHADNPEKYQYPVFEIESNDKTLANRFIEKMSKAETLDRLLDCFDSDAKTMRQYCENFRPVLLEMTAWSMSQSVIAYRREWRLKNEFKRNGG